MNKLTAELVLLDLLRPLTIDGFNVEFTSITLRKSVILAYNLSLVEVNQAI